MLQLTLTTNNENQQIITHLVLVKKKSKLILSRTAM